MMAELEKALFLNDGKKLKEYLRKYMITCISNIDGASEAFYHSMMLGLAAGISSKYYIQSNRSGDGIFNLVLKPKLRTLPGIIKEFKAVKEEELLITGAEEALRQIDTKNYDTDSKDRGIQDIVKYGISFYGKKV